MAAVAALLVLLTIHYSVLAVAMIALCWRVYWDRNNRSVGVAMLTAI
jgi:hypothetical protein